MVAPVVALLIACLAMAMTSCKSPGEYGREADEVAYDIIQQKQQEGLGKTEPLAVESPADTLRRRLMLEQHLPHSGPASLSTKDLEPIEHWPDDEDYLDRPGPADGSEPTLEPKQALYLSLEDALQVAASNSRDYQSRKEEVFRAALALDLERDEFRNTFAGLMEGLISTDHGGDDVVTGTRGSATGSLVRRFENGVTVTSRIAFDLAKLLTQDRSSSRGILFDASIEIPLLRGAGRWVVTEPLQQAERNALYEIYDFERFKRTFAVSVARNYLDVLRQLDEVKNTADNYGRLIGAARRARRLADAGRLPEVQVDQAVQDELRARDRWIQARESYARRLDNFKLQLGLPTDAQVELEPETLVRLAETAEQALARMAEQQGAVADQETVPADAPVTLVEPSREEGGPYEIDETLAIELALENRLDLRIAEGQVYDTQRRVAVAANDFLPELTLLGAATAGERRGIGSAGSPDAQLRFEKGQYDALLTLDLPLERTAERNAYRNALINMERAVRDVQGLEDTIKFDIRDNLRTLLQSREGVRIQATAVALAERRVESTDLFLQAGRAEIRDVLEAQEALVSAQNALTAAMVNYRIAELQLQSDLGLLEVNEKGLWQEYNPERFRDDEQKDAE